MRIVSSTGVSLDRFVAQGRMPLSSLARQCSLRHVRRPPCERATCDGIEVQDNRGTLWEARLLEREAGLLRTYGRSNLRAKFIGRNS